MRGEGVAESAEWKVGRFRIRNLVETDAGSAIQEVISEARPDVIAGIVWLAPHFADAWKPERCGAVLLGF